MKIRLDYITNSSSSSYIICTKKSIEDFLKEILPKIVRSYYNNEFDLEIIKSFLITDNKEIKSKRRASVIFYHSFFYHSLLEREKIKDKIFKIFNNFSEDMRFYLTDEISDKDGQIAEDLDLDRIFDYDKIKDIPDLEIFYMNHH